MELDDPFAEDSNDLPLAEECRAAVEDIILSLYFADEKSAATKLESEIPTFGDMDFYDELVLNNQINHSSN